MNVADLAEWTPMRIHWELGHPAVRWCYMGRERFVEPFFEDTINKRLREPFNLLFQHETPLDALLELQELEPGLPPTGLIFHMSRCGSTLVAQMLAASAQNIVISEAGPIDALLRAHSRDTEIGAEMGAEQRIAWLRALLSAYARPRDAGERHFFVKFDSWHTLELPLIRQAFPNVPWIFLYRDPLQVLVSHQRQRGGQMVHDLLPPQWLGLDQTSTGGASLDEYSARVLNRICEAALSFQDAGARLVNYRQLPEAMWGEIAGHFGLCLTPDNLDAMRQAAHFDAKNPRLDFVADSLEKERLATAELRRLADLWLMPVYNALEAQRTGADETQVRLGP